MDIVMKQTVAIRELYCLGDQEMNILFDNPNNLRAVAHHVAYSLAVVFCPDRIVAKDVKSDTNCCYVKSATLIV